jgi:DNA-binding NarL/FixJ family response regulator
MEQNLLRSATVKVFVFGADPLSQAGMATFLRGHSAIELVPQSRVDEASVALIVADGMDEATLRVVRAVQRDDRPRVVLVLTDVDAAGVRAAVAAGVVGIVRRSAATRDQLLAAVKAAAAGDGVLPPDLLGGLLRQVREHGAAGPDAGRSRPSDRELHVLRLLSDGHDTREIARRLAYSERTVKNIIQDMTRRFGVRNRSHAVAFALRTGLI